MGLLRGKSIFSGSRVVRDIATGRLIAEPFTDIALDGARALGQFRRSDRASLSHRLVKPELVADHDQGHAHAGADVVDCLAEELLQLRFVDGHVSPPAGSRLDFAKWRHYYLRSRNAKVHSANAFTAQRH